MTDWTGLLNWSLAQVDPEPSPDVKPLSEEDRKFLMAAMESIVVDEVKRMKALIKALRLPEEAKAIKEALLQHHNSQSQSQSPSADPEADARFRSLALPDLVPVDEVNSKADEELEAAVVAAKEDALEELDDRVITLPMAQDFYKIGGFPVLQQTLASKKPSLQIKAAQVWSTLLQNNIQCQKWALEMGVLASLIAQLPSEHHKLVSKVLGAISSFVRTHRVAERQFIEAQGLPRLIKLLSVVATPNDIKRKALVLLRHLLRCNADYRKTARALGVVKVVTDLVGHEDDIDIREQSVKTLMDIGRWNASELAETKALFDKYQVQQKLQARLTQLRALANEEEKDAAQFELASIEKMLGMLERNEPMPAQHVATPLDDLPPEEHVIRQQLKEAESKAPVALLQ